MTKPRLSYAEVKALCAGDDRIKQKMDLDIEVSKLKLLKSNHQSQQFRMQDDIMTHFPEKIESYERLIVGLKVDEKTVYEHPHPTDGFSGMEVNGNVLSDKEAAGTAILEACKNVTGLEPVKIGSYRGFSMSLTLENFSSQYVLTMKGEISHRVELGKDTRGNLIRMDNVLNAIPERIKVAEMQLESVRGQLETAKAEVGKPFPKEDELRTKSARLNELNAELNIDERTPIEKAADTNEKTSVIEKLRNTVPVAQHRRKTLILKGEVEVMANEKNSEIYRTLWLHTRESMGRSRMWRESKAMNIACRDAIDKAVAENYDGAHLKTDKILDAVVSDFGRERVELVLAATIQEKPFMTDGSRTPTRSGRKMYRWLLETSATWSATGRTRSCLTRSLKPFERIIRRESLRLLSS